MNAIKNFPTPKNLTDIRSWFGLVNQVAHYAQLRDILAPFKRFFSPKRKFNWSDEPDKAFSDFKTAITDASRHGVKSLLLRDGTTRKSNRFWPGITQDINNIRNSSVYCNRNAPSQTAIPPIPINPPTTPFEHIFADYFDYGGRCFGDRGQILRLGRWIWDIVRVKRCGCQLLWFASCERILLLSECQTKYRLMAVPHLQLRHAAVSQNSGR